MTDLKCPRCGREGHLPVTCDVPVLPEDRVLAVTSLPPFPSPSVFDPGRFGVAYSQTQMVDFATQARADLESELVEQARIVGMGAERELALMSSIERKDALLRRALGTIHEAQTYTNSEAWSPSMTRDLQMLRLAITKELQ